MTITELINKLSQLRDEYGDLRVFDYNQDASDYFLPTVEYCEFSEEDISNWNEDHEIEDILKGLPKKCIIIYSYDFE